jgi:transposase
MAAIRRREVLIHDAVPAIPGPTGELARFAFSPDQRFLALGDHLDEVVEGIGGRHSGVPGSYVLALLTVLQYLEGLTDPGAAHALRTHIDWKYAFHLPLDYEGLPVERLREYRMAASLTPVAMVELGLLGLRLDRLDPRWWDGAPPLDGSAVLLGVHARNSLPLLARTLGGAVAATNLVKAGGRAEHPLLQAAFEPLGRGAGAGDRRCLDALAKRIAREGFALLDRVRAPGAPAMLRDADEVRLLAEVWRNHFVRLGGGVAWRFPTECGGPEREGDHGIVATGPC